MLSQGEDMEWTDKLFAAILASLTDAKPEDESEPRA
jgi:hypothetical protein